jgi:hypothetical protein
MNEYNTSKQFLILKEYGRNVQKLVEYIITIEDRDKRTNYAKTLIELMRQINPSMQNSQDYSQKLWDDLYIMSQFRLDVDSPFPLPEKSALGKKPKRIPYNTNEIKYKHYGRNVDLLIQKAIEMPEGADKENAVMYIGRLMKGFYSTWNKENIDDIVIIDHLRELSKGKLKVDAEKIRTEGVFDINTRENRERERTERTERNDRPDRNDRGQDRKNFKKRRPDGNNNNPNNSNNPNQNNKRRKI